MRGTGGCFRTICRSPRSSGAATATPGPGPERRTMLEILTRERPVYPERRFCSFGRRHNRKLHVLDDVSGDEDARHARGLVATALHAAATGELASEGLGQPRSEEHTSELQSP